MRALKSLVVGLGVLIVIGMALLVWGFYQKAADPGFRLFADPPAPPGAPPGGPFADVVLGLPAGCSIADMEVQGERLYLRIGPPGECMRVVIVDVVRGAVIGTIRGTP